MRTTTLAVAATMVLTMGFTGATHAQSVTMSADNLTPLVGQVVTFNYAMDFTADSTFGGGSDFFYDATVLQFIGWTFDAGLNADDEFYRRDPTDCTTGAADAGCAFDADEFGAGLAQVNGMAFGSDAGSGLAGPLLIGQMTFLAVGEGVATIFMAMNDDGVIGNPGPFVSGNSFQIQSVSFFSDSVTVGAGVPDTDMDGVLDSTDNCTQHANAAQRDSDGDGIGNACDADLNNDCIVNPIDLGLFRTRFFTTDPDADFNGDGVVNPQDLGILRSLFFSPPGPSGVPNICD